MADTTDRIRPGDSILIIQCKHCRHVSEVILPTADSPLVPGQPAQVLRHTCLNGDRGHGLRREERKGRF